MGDVHMLTLVGAVDDCVREALQLEESQMGSSTVASCWQKPQQVGALGSMPNSPLLGCERALHDIFDVAGERGELRHLS